jgi:hypothetical protein
MRAVPHRSGTEKFELNLRPEQTSFPTAHQKHPKIPPFENCWQILKLSAIDKVVSEIAIIKFYLEFVVLWPKSILADSSM